MTRMILPRGIVHVISVTEEDLLLLTAQTRSLYLLRISRTRSAKIGVFWKLKLQLREKFRSGRLWTIITVKGDQMKSKNVNLVVVARFVVPGDLLQFRSKTWRTVRLITGHWRESEGNFFFNWKWISRGLLWPIFVDLSVSVIKLLNFEVP